MGRSPFLGASASPVFARDKSLCQSPLLETLLEGIESLGLGLQLPVPVVDLDADLSEDLKHTTILGLGQKLGDCLPPNLGVQRKNTFLDIYESCPLSGRARANTDSAVGEWSNSYKSDPHSATSTLDAGSAPSEDSDARICTSPVASNYLSHHLGDGLSPRIGIRVNNTFLDLHEPCPHEGARPRSSTDFACSYDGPITRTPPSSVPDEVHFAPAWCYVDYFEGAPLIAHPVDVATDDELLPLVEKVHNARLSDEFITSLLGPLPSGCFVPDWKGPSHITPTTLLLDNLPTDLTQVVLLEVLDREDFSGLYDFVFLPVDGEGVSCGYAVVNVASHACGVRLATRLHGRTDWAEDIDNHSQGVKPCNVTWSQPLQGLADNIRMYRNHPSNDASVDEDVRPQLFSRGWPVPFPKPSLPHYGIAPGVEASSDV